MFSTSLSIVSESDYSLSGISAFTDSDSLLISSNNLSISSWSTSLSSSPFCNSISTSSSFDSSDELISELESESRDSDLLLDADDD